MTVISFTKLDECNFSRQFDENLMKIWQHLLLIIIESLFGTNKSALLLTKFFTEPCNDEMPKWALWIL